MGHPVGLYLAQNMAISRELNSIRFCDLMQATEATEGLSAEQNQFLLSLCENEAPCANHDAQCNIGNWGRFLSESIVVT